MSQEFIATGRRKDAVARIRMSPGTGKIQVNGRPFDEYFKTTALQNTVLQPFETAKAVNQFDVSVNTTGGGTTGQAGAIRLGIARALIEYDESLKTQLRKAGFVTRDAREVERKKVGLHKARRATQFSKR